MEGHEVIEASDGIEVLDRLEPRAGGHSPEVVLLDAMMPHAEGAGVLKKIKADFPRMPVLVVSALHSLDDSEGWDLADGHVTKPIDFSELFARIEALTVARPRP